ncbi:unnamed protein product [Lupinus luteus]|uniref:Alliinase C-terminal domain-containing protein n=1 Tax=Lupinus luteus TaxID=3873 RepID=A0AAV1WXB2_LUPLU
MTKFIDLNTTGVSKDPQLGVAMALKVVSDSTEKRKKTLERENHSSSTAVRSWNKGGGN